MGAKVRPGAAAGRPVHALPLLLSINSQPPPPPARSEARSEASQHLLPHGCAPLSHHLMASPTTVGIFASYPRSDDRQALFMSSQIGWLYD